MHDTQSDRQSDPVAESAGEGAVEGAVEGAGAEAQPFRSKDPRVRSLVRHLVSLAATADEKPASRAALAELRQGVSDPLRVAKHVVPHLGAVAEGEWERRRQEAEELWFYRVAALFALHRRHQVGQSLGRALRRCVDERKSESIEGRFLALLSAGTPEQLADRLRGVVTLLAADDIPLDWCAVLDDVLGWERPGKPRQHYLARHFYYRAAPPEDAAAATVPAAAAAVAAAAAAAE